MLEHPDVVKLAFGLLLGLVIYLYKQNESKSAKLIATKLDQICNNLDRLFSRDEQKTEAIIEISERLVKQEQRCDDREKTCPGKFALKTIQKNKKGPNG